jgi:2-amino-4-hydroxy-6-hydroxymethyldihydropteridine diphosphokinase
MPRLWISIGSNINAEANVRGAVDALRTEFGEVVLSPVYESAAVGFEGPPFLNLVAGVTTALPATRVMQILARIEARFGRGRGHKKLDSRTLDLDLLTYGTDPVIVGGRQLPRDEVLEYAFVLKPLADVAPQERHPLDGRTYAQLWAAYGGDRSAILAKDLRLE